MTNVYEVSNAFIWGMSMEAAKDKIRNEDHPSEFLTGDQVLHLLGVSVSWPRHALKRLRRQGLEAVRVGARYRYTRDAVEQFIQRWTVPPGHIWLVKASARLDPPTRTWLKDQVASGRLEAFIRPDGQAFVPEREVRRLLAGRRRCA